MTEVAKSPYKFRVADLPNRKETTFEVKPDAETLKAMAGELGIAALRKVAFAGKILPQGKRDWALEARLGATVVQPCVVTLDPVTTRIEEPVRRTYLADFSAMGPQSEEVEMPEDDTLEPLPAVIDVEAVLMEALSLALPLYPRADGAEFGQMDKAPPGTEALTDETVKPFAALGKLVGGLKKDPEEGEK